MGKSFIVISGNIGSGKTTLTRMLSERYGWDAHFESHQDNPYLSDFYVDMNRWALAVQVYLLTRRFQSHKKILAGSTSAIQDRSIYEDAHIFARTLFESGQMPERDFENYLGLYRTMIAYLTPPDLIVYLRRSIPVIQKRIRERGYSFEQNIPVEYLARLDRCYEDWIGDYHLGKVLTIDADDLDVKNNPADFNLVCEKIENSLDQRALPTL